MLFVLLGLAVLYLGNREEANCDETGTNNNNKKKMQQRQEREFVFDAIAIHRNGMDTRARIK